MNKLDDFNPIFFPNSHAIVGASSNLAKFGGRFVKAQITFCYKGKIFPVNREESEIFGMRTYPSILDIPEPVDFASILVPAPAVPKVLEECLQKGVKGAQIITAGFSECDEKGSLLEKKIATIAANGIHVIGPNCFGVYCPRGGLTIPPGAKLSKESGNVGCISQSGGLSFRIARRADGLKIRFSKLISYGNACDIDECDLLEYLYEDPDTKIIIGYIEGVKNGPKFFELLKKVTKVKPVILWKGGLTAGGERAVKSHTASLSGVAHVWEALFKQTGAISVVGLDELISTTLAFSLLPPIRGRKFAVVIGGGGLGVDAADAFEKTKIPLPSFPDEIQRKLLRIIPQQGTSARNPVDMGSPSPPPASLKAALETLFSDAEIDLIIISDINLRVTSSANTGIQIGEQTGLESQQIPLCARGKFNKPIIVVLREESSGVEYIDSEKRRRNAAAFYLQNGVPVFSTMDDVAKVVAKVVGYWEYRDKVQENYDSVSATSK